MSGGDYVCAFRGRRDDYQVPVALAEAGALAGFITDAYASAGALKLAAILPGRWAEKLRSRRDERLPDDKIHCLWMTTASEHARKFIGRPPAESYALLDDRYSRAAAAMARQKEANLFLYSPYAWTAFSQSYRHDPRKLLFQFHPHVATERRILSEDWTRFADTISGALVLENVDAFKTDTRNRSDDSWKRADHVVCASSFSRKSLIDAGADAARISVVPYGVEVDVAPAGLTRNPFFHVIFVGSGLQRKGLHHLLLAWQRASLPADSKLTLICRIVEPAFLPLIAATPRAQLIRGLSRAQLERLYGSATLLAMPSLIEGFGQVYLEALGHGLPVLGTAQTGLPDLGSEADGIYSCESGNIEELAETLTRLSRTLPSAPDVNARARLCAGRFSWQSFRSRIRELL